MWLRLLFHPASKQHMPGPDNEHGLRPGYQEIGYNSSILPLEMTIIS